MDLKIKDKVFILSGSGRGIGASIARAIADEGGIPVIIDLDQANINGLLTEFQNKNQTAFGIKKRLGTPKSCEEVIAETLDKFGKIDGVVNNAGVNDGVGLEKGSPEAWLKSLDRNLNHYYYLTHYALPALKKSGGCILNISSKTALTGQGNTSAYAASKGAILALTREWAVELLSYNIRVNAIVPAEVMTPLYEKWLATFHNPQEKLTSIEKNIPLQNRMTSSSEIADMAAFLLSARAAHITGQHLFVDGGYVHLDRSLSVLND